MGRGIAKKDSSLSIAIVVAIVLIASVLLILRPSPEQVVAVSPDAIVRVEGVSRSSGQLVIQRLDGIATSIPDPLSPLYEATWSSDGVLEQGQVTFLYRDLNSEVPIQDLDIYLFDRETLTWKSLATFFDLDEQTLTARVEFSGSLLVGVGKRVL